MKTKNIFKDFLGNILRDLGNKSKVLRRFFFGMWMKIFRCNVEDSFNIFS